MNRVAKGKKERKREKMDVKKHRVFFIGLCLLGMLDTKHTSFCFASLAK